MKNGTLEEQEPLQVAGSSRLIFAHEQNPLRRMVDQDSFETLPDVFVVPSHDAPVIVTFAGGMGYSGGAGSAGGVGSTGGAGGPGGAGSLGVAGGFGR